MNNSLLQKKKRKSIFFFLLFPLILLFLFGLLPIFYLTEYSFTSWNGLSEAKTFVGLDNYLRVLSDPRYYRVFLTSLYYLGSGLLQMGIALYFAIILSAKVKWKGFFKASMVFPLFVSGVAISMMFRMFFSPDGGFNDLLSAFGLQDSIQFWLGNPRFSNWTLAGVSLWRYTGMSFILYFAAIQSIPPEYSKIAAIEGASWWQNVREVIIPNIKTVLRVNFILLTIGAVSVFELPLIMTNGSNGTTTFLLQTMKTAFDKKMIGLASSMAVIVTLILILLTGIQKKVYGNDAEDN